MVRIRLRPSNGRGLLRHALLAAVLVALLAAADAQIFFTNLTDTGLWDCTMYARGGWELFHRGLLPRIAWAPLLAVFHAGAYALFQGSQLWMLHSLHAARLLFAFLLCFAVFRIGRRLPPGAGARELAVALALLPSVGILARNESDALYAVCSAFALLALLAYRDTGRTARLLAASACVGLAALARLDGIVLFPLYLASVALIRRDTGRPRSPASVLRTAAAATLPFLLIVASAYVVTGAQRDGRYEVGWGFRSYMAFTHAQFFTYSEQYRSIAETGPDIERLFGKEPENRSSVPRAILRNPGAWARRLAYGVAHRLPEQSMEAYGPAVFLVLPLAFLGLGVVLRRGGRRLVCALLLWMLPVLAYAMTFFRSGYLLHSYFLVITLAVIGARALMAAPFFDGRSRPWAFAVVGFALLAVAAARVAGIAGRQATPVAADPAVRAVALLYAHTLPGDTVVSDRVGEAYAAEREYLPNPLLRREDDARAWLSSRRIAAFVFRDGYDPSLPRALERDSSRYRRLPAPAPYRIFVPQSRTLQ